MKRTIISIIALISALSCSRKEIIEEVVSDMTTYARHSFEVAYPDKDSTATRSVMDADPDEIRDVCTFAFDASNGELLRYRSKIDGKEIGDPVMAYVSGSSSFEWYLPLGVEMDIYAVCNMGHMDAPDNLPEFLASPGLVYEISDVSDLNDSGIPMTAVLKGVRDDTGSSTYVLPARRIVSRYSLKLTEMPADYEVTGIRICNVNSRTTLFAENEAADDASVLVMGDWATEEDLKALNSGGTAEFHMFENAQTTTGGIHLESGSEWFEVHGLLEEGTGLCTYLDIISNHNGDSRRDRLYLGKNCTGNFDVIRNTVRHVTCPAPVSLISGAGQDVLRFTENVQAAPGETIELKFRYNLALSGASPSSIAFSADTGLTLGTPVFSSVGSGFGTGSIPVTCSASVNIGDKLSVRMASGDASAETEIEVINKVISVTISSPLTQVRVRSVQLQAEAVYADGTIVTDPALFSWKILSGSSRATVKDGLVSRIGYKYGVVLITAELEGVTSNKLTFSFNSIILELFSEPAEIYVSEGNSTSMALYYQVSKINDQAGTDVTVTTTAALKASSTEFSVTDPSIASAEGNSSGDFIITGNKNGMTSLDIRYNHKISNLDYGIATLDVPVIVGDYQYELELDTSSLSLPVGGTAQLEAWFVTYFKGAVESRINVTDKAEWSSSLPGYVTVSNGLVEAVKAISYGKATIYAGYNGYFAQAKVKTHNAVTYELVVNAKSLYLNPGDGEQLSAILHRVSNGVYDSGTDVTSEALWSSGQTDIVTVSQYGYIRAVSSGRTNIYAEYDGYNASIPIEVLDDTEYSSSLEISPSYADIETGSYVDLTATHISYADGSAYSYEDVTDWNVCFWSSSNPSVASVSAGRVTGISEGTATITASYGSDRATATVHVGPSGISDDPDPVITNELVVTADQTEFTGGGNATATTTYITYADGVRTSSSDVTSFASWSSANTAVATVSGGRITVNNVDGTAEITAAYNGEYGSVTIYANRKEDPVPDPVITNELVVTADQTEFTGGGNATATATYITYTDGVRTASSDVTSTASWSSGNTSVATVSEGRITVNNVDGTAEITAAYNGEYGSVTIYANRKEDPVPDPVITNELVVTADQTEFTGGGNATATATYITYADGVRTASSDVTSTASWSSGNTSVATVSEGRITVNNVDGTATITATYDGHSDSYDIVATKVAETYMLVLDPSSVTINVGGNGSMKAMYLTYRKGSLHSSENVTSAADWSSSNGSVVGVNKGLLVGYRSGSASITASYNGSSVSGTVTVNPVASLSVGWADAEMLAGSTKVQSLIYDPGDGSAVTDVSSIASWESSNSSVATVNEGIISAHSSGKATLTGTYKGLSASCTVTVTNPPVSKVNIRHASSDSRNYTVCLDLTLSDGTVLQNVGYTWTCTYASDTSIMSGNSSGNGPISYLAGSDDSYNFLLVTTDMYNVGGRIQPVTATANGIKATAFY